MKYKFTKNLAWHTRHPKYTNFIWQYQNTSKWYTYKEALALVKRSTRNK